MQYIAFDSHKKYTLASVEAVAGGAPREVRIAHERGNIKYFLKQCDPGSPVAVETIGNWYWIVDEIEAAGMQPRLVNARKAKLMIGCVNKTDKLDARGMNLLQRTGTLPTVWIPDAETRDLRDLPRTRMFLVRQRTQLKNRIHATLAKYGLNTDGPSDLFGVKGMAQIRAAIAQLPKTTAYVAECVLAQLASVNEQILELEARIKVLIRETAEIRLLMSMPGIGPILSTVIALEIGTIDRFPGAPHLAAYAGTTPRVFSSGDKTRYGRTRDDVNRYLKWAYVEAGNAVCVNRRAHADRHVSRLYNRLVDPKGHQKAIGAVARHLAEATYWVLKKKEPYREPKSDNTVLSTKE